MSKTCKKFWVVTLLLWYKEPVFLLVLSFKSVDYHQSFVAIIISKNNLKLTSRLYFNQHNFKLLYQHEQIKSHKYCYDAQCFSQSLLWSIPTKISQASDCFCVRCFIVSCFTSQCLNHQCLATCKDTKNVLLKKPKPFKN